MVDVQDLERRVTVLEQRVAAGERLRQQEHAEIKSDIAVLAAQMAAFEQRTNRRFLDLETRMATLEARVGALEDFVRGEFAAVRGELAAMDGKLATMQLALATMQQALDTILRKLP